MKTLSSSRLNTYNSLVGTGRARGLNQGSATTPKHPPRRLDRPSFPFSILPLPSHLPTSPHSLPRHLPSTREHDDALKMTATPPASPRIRPPNLRTSSRTSSIRRKPVPLSGDEYEAQSSAESSAGDFNSPRQGSAFELPGPEAKEGPYCRPFLSSNAYLTPPCARRALLGLTHL